MNRSKALQASAPSKVVTNVRALPEQAARWKKDMATATLRLREITRISGTPSGHPLRAQAAAAKWAGKNHSQGRVFRLLGYHSPPTGTLKGSINIRSHEQEAGDC